MNINEKNQTLDIRLNNTGTPFYKLNKNEKEVFNQIKEYSPNDAFIMDDLGIWQHCEKNKTIKPNDVVCVSTSFQFTETTEIRYVYMGTHGFGRALMCEIGKKSVWEDGMETAETVHSSYVDYLVKDNNHKNYEINKDEFEYIKHARKHTEFKEFKEFTVPKNGQQFIPNSSSPDKNIGVSVSVMEDSTYINRLVFLGRRFCKPIPTPKIKCSGMCTCIHRIDASSGRNADKTNHNAMCSLPFNSCSIQIKVS